MRTHVLTDIVAWLVALAVGYGVWTWRLKDVDMHAATRWSRPYLLALATGAIVGAFVVGTANLWLSARPGVARSVAGGLLGAIAAVEIMKSAYGVRGSTGLYYAAPLAAGIGIGRIGCFFAGLPDFTYGIASSADWAYDFGDGVRRHPVQLYEAAAMATFMSVYLSALALRWRPAMELGFYAFIAWYGVERFVLEFYKPYGTIVGPLNTFHFVCAILTAYGLTMLYRQRRARRRFEVSDRVDSE